MTVPIYSHSRLETYQNCPLKYKFQYIDRLPRKTEGIEAFVGSRVHEVLEKLYRDLLNGKRNTREELLDFYNQQWERNWNQKSINIVRKDYAPEHYYKAGWLCVDSYYARYQPFDGDKTLAVEVRVAFDLNHEPGHRMLGYIDRLARGKDDVWEIHDYKTSGALPTQEEVDAKPQLALYQIGLQQMWPQIRSVRLVWHLLRHDTALSSTWSSGQLKDLRLETIDLIDQIEAEKDYSPRESGLCDWCDFQDRCPLKKHPLKVATMTLQELGADDAVTLVDQYADLMEQRQALERQESEIQEQMKAVEDRIIAYGCQEGMDVLAGSRYLAKIHHVRKITLPRKGEDRRLELEKFLQRVGKWDQVTTLNLQNLKQVIAKSQWDQSLLRELKGFATDEMESTVSLTRKNEER